VVTAQDVRDAAAGLAGVAVRTPLRYVEPLDAYLKLETLQPVGAFKLRGAYTAIRRLPAAARCGGVITYSSGNHGQAVAYAAQLVGVRAVVVMPETAPAVKVAGVKRWGGEVVFAGRTSEDRQQHAEALAARERLAIVPPFDHPDIVAGQATVGLEIAEQLPDVRTVVVPVGGGGLIAGTASAVDGAARVIGVEPEAGDDTRRSLEAGERVAIEVPRTIADGLQATSPGRLTFEVNRERVEGIVTVSDEEIVEAMAFLFERMKLVTEPSGAVGVAALLRGRIEARGRVGVIVSGGNVGLARFAELVGAHAA
jgi:threonine dehydratase